MTATAFAAVSLDPLLVLVSVERGSRFHAAVADALGWGVSILGTGAEPSARWLATKGRELAGQLDDISIARSPVLGVAWLEEALATLECRTVDSHRAGDHDIVVGEVLTIGSIGADESGGGRVADPLLYFQRHYRRIDSGETQ